MLTPLLPLLGLFATRIRSLGAVGAYITYGIAGVGLQARPGSGRARDVYRSVPKARSERCLICVDVAFDTSKVSFFTRRGYRQRDKISLISTPRRRPRITEKRNAKKIGLCIRCGVMDYSEDSLERKYQAVGHGPTSAERMRKGLCSSSR